MKSIRVSVDESLHRELKLACVRRGMSIKAAVITAIKMLLERWREQERESGGPGG